MRLHEVLQNIDYIGGSDDRVRRIEYNSRKACPGDLFVCLTGGKRDGHNYAEQAYENGCRMFLCERRLDLPSDAVQAITPDTRAALAVISADFYGRPADRLHLIGITGTKGKTTTALLIAAILNAAGKNCAYIGSNGVIINGKRTETVNTTPESRDLHHYFNLMTNASVRYAVLEVSSQALAHHRVDGIRFEMVVFTNLSEDHIGQGEHPDFEDYRSSKRRLFSSHDAKTAVYNADDPAAEFMLDGFAGQRVSYGIRCQADYNAYDLSRYRTATTLGVDFYCRKGNRTEHVHLMSPGMFSVYNGLAAIAVCELFGISRDFSARVLQDTPVQGRFEVVPGIPGRTFIIDYAHNGLSLTNALKTLREYDPGRLICVFGSVGGRTKGRRKELAQAASALADYCIITSDNPDFEAPEDVVNDIASYMEVDSNYECIIDRRTAIFRAVQMAQDGGIILFAGKGHETYQLVCGNKQPFVEREVVLEACKEFSPIQ